MEYQREYTVSVGESLFTQRIKQSHSIYSSNYNILLNNKKVLQYTNNNYKTGHKISCLHVEYVTELTH